MKTRLNSRQIAFAPSLSIFYCAQHLEPHNSQAEAFACPKQKLVPVSPLRLSDLEQLGSGLEASEIPKHGLAAASHNEVPGIEVHSADLTIRSMNAPFIAMTGFQEAELAGKKAVSLWPEDALRDFQDVADAIPAGREAGIVTQIQKANGEAIGVCLFGSASSSHIFTLRFVPLPQERGERIPTARVIEFLSTMAHELRNPMMPILGHAQLLRKLHRAGDLGDRFVRLLDRLDLAVDVFARRATLLMEVSRIAAGQLNLRPEPLDLSELAAEAIGRHRSVAEATGVSLSLDAPAPVLGLFDRIAMEQVIDNLISNALKFAAEKPVSVRVGHVDRWAVLDVQDQGVGIAQDRLIRIFDYLDQGGLPVRNGGFGIGLWVVRHLATAMGGDVSVESQLNRGSTFTLKVPITPKEDRG